MRRQLIKLEQDLEDSKRIRLQQDEEFNKQLKSLTERHKEEVRFEMCLNQGCRLWKQ